MRIKRTLRAISVAADGRLIATDGSCEHPAAQLWAPPRFSGLVIRLNGEGRVHVIIGQRGVVNQIVGDGLMAIFCRVCRPDTAQVEPGAFWAASGDKLHLPVKERLGTRPEVSFTGSMRAD